MTTDVSLRDYESRPCHLQKVATRRVAKDVPAIPLAATRNASGVNSLGA